MFEVLHKGYKLSKLLCKKCVEEKYLFCSKRIALANFYFFLYYVPHPFRNLLKSLKFPTKLCQHCGNIIPLIWPSKGGLSGLYVGHV